MNKTPRTETVVKMAVGPMREYAIIEHAQTLERELLKAREERDEAVKSEISAIEAWDEERKRAIREGERVLEAREKYLAMRGLRNNATELAEKYKQERDEAREAAAMWEKVALREASMNGSQICGKEAAQ